MLAIISVVFPPSSTVQCVMYRTEPYVLAEMQISSCIAEQVSSVFNIFSFYLSQRGCVCLYATKIIQKVKS